MVHIWQTVISNLAGNLNSSLIYLITTVFIWFFFKGSKNSIQVWKKNVVFCRFLYLFHFFRSGGIKLMIESQTLHHFLLILRSTTFETPTILKRMDIWIKIQYKIWKYEGNWLHKSHCLVEFPESINNLGCPMSPPIPMVPPVLPLTYIEPCVKKRPIVALRTLSYKHSIVHTNRLANLLCSSFLFQVTFLLVIYFYCFPLAPFTSTSQFISCPHKIVSKILNEHDIFSVTGVYLSKLICITKKICLFFFI